jgi:2-phospho-L-lactate/phosphoenolpyruvate guanylyltransferase
MLETSLRWSLVIPVKVLALAKSRLTGLPGARRAELALAMAADAVSAASACPAVDTVIVVTDDGAVAAELSGLGALVLPDEPALGAAELGRALAEAARAKEAFVADAAGTGTTLYTAAPGVAFSPRFGPGSREAHRSAGAVELLLPGLDGLRRDVDTIDDLHDAARIGLGPHTSAAAGTLE